MEMKTIDFSEKDAGIMIDSFSFYSDMEDAIKKMSIDNLDLLYHYTTPDGLTGITGGEDLIFRFSQSDFLNDSSEGLDIFEHYYAVLEEMRTSSQAKTLCRLDMFLIFNNPHFPLIKTVNNGKGES